MRSGRSQPGWMAPALAGYCLLFCLGSFAAELTELSLEELMDVEVTSVSKRPEKQREVPAAVYVITAEDIQRAGATNIRDALRMVPGIQVARQGSNAYHISARGFGGRFSNKLLVLLDGRVLYTPLFSGVFWETLDLAVADIARIEVIRGPGGTLWGANAVNGVISIVTKPAQETAGGLVEIGGGTEEKIHTTLRYGGKLRERLYYRVFGTFTDHDSGRRSDGGQGLDNWRQGRAGLRLDWENEQNSFTFLADYFSSRTTDSDIVPIVLPPFSETLVASGYLRGGSLNGRFTHRFDEDRELRLQLYYDLFKDDAQLIREERHTWDLDLQYSFDLGTRHRIVLGGGVRYIDESIGNGPSIELDPASRDYSIFNVYLQDQITLKADEVVLTIGAKLEHNDFSGFEFQPNLRLAWTPNSTHTVWGAVSRALRTPSRADSDSEINTLGFPLGVAGLEGSRNFESEVLVAWELGYRYRHSASLSLDAAVYYNQYDKLRSLEIKFPRISFGQGFPHIFLPLEIRNDLEADTYGLEAAIDWRPRDWWRMRLNYTYFEYEKKSEGTLLNVFDELSDGDTPQHQAWLQNSFQLGPEWDLDVVFRYADRLPILGVDDYITADVRLGWRPREDLEISVTGRNLLETSHREADAKFVGTTTTEVERSVFGMVTWRF